MSVPRCESRTRRRTRLKRACVGWRRARRICGLTPYETITHTRPRVDVVKSTGLADNRIKELKELLVTSASENLGVQMVVQLASDVQDYLVQHNHKPMSAYEAMQSRAAEETKRVRARSHSPVPSTAAPHCCTVCNSLRRRQSGKPSSTSEPWRKKPNVPRLCTCASSQSCDGGVLESSGVCPRYSPLPAPPSRGKPPRCRRCCHSTAAPMATSPIGRCRDRAIAWILKKSASWGAVGLGRC